MSVAAVLRHAGIAAVAAPASELAFFPQSQFGQDFVLIAIPRSGTTTETLWAMEAYRKQRPSGTIVAITCNESTPMIANADVMLIAPDAREQSIAQTRSLTSMVLMGQLLAAILSDDRGAPARLRHLPDTAGSAMARYGALAAQLGRDLSLQRFFFLAAGAMHGLACEAMLKTKEMTCSWSEAFYPLEFRHGPMSVANSDSLVVGFISDSAADAEIAVLRDMKKLGARTLAITERTGDGDWSGVDHIVALNSGLSEWERGIACLPFVQRMAYHRSLAKGLDPDAPQNLTAVVTLA
jgi:glucosamine--fructose-6-phosphate aminotransferase (isomerizing)